MKLKKLLAAVTAAALAITTMAVTSFTASAASFTPYILLNVNSQDWGINGAWVAADKTEITAGQTEYEFTYTAGKDDTWDGDKAQITAYCYSPIDNLKNVSIKSVSINGVDKGISASAGAFNEYTWDQLQSTTVPGYAITVDSATVKGLGAVSSGDVFKLVVTATIDESAKSIGSSNFTCSKAAGELVVGESFTISYDSTNTPDTAQWLVKCAFDADFADHGITNRWPQLVNADGSVDNSAAADTGLEVAKTAEGVYTFTAVNASKAGYAINVEASAAGDWTDTQYLGQGGGNWSVAVADDPTPKGEYTIELEEVELTMGDTATKIASLVYYDETGNKSNIACSKDTENDIGSYEWTWVSENEEIATIIANGTENGLMTPVSVGKTKGQVICNFTPKTGGENTTYMLTFDINVKAADEGDDTPTTTTLWAGTTEIGNWDNSVEIASSNFANAKAGDKIAVTYTVSTNSQLSFKHKADGWPGLPGFIAGDGGEWAVLNVSTDGTYAYTLTEADVAAIKANPLIVGGQYITITKVEYITTGSSGGTENPPVVNPPVEPSTPTTPDTPVTPPSSGGSVIWSGNQTIGTGWDWGQVVTVPASSVSAGNTIRINFSTGSAEYHQLKIMYASNAENMYNVPGMNEWNCIDVTASPFTFTINAADAAELSSNGMFIHGYDVTIISVEVVGAGGDNPSTPSEPSNPSEPSVPGSASSTYEPPIPSGSASISVVDSILGSSAASVSFNLGSNAKLDKEVFEAIASKGDVNVRFNVAGGAYWEIGGANITAAKAVDLGVRMNSTLIPASAVSELAGDKTTIQLSLKHNGDFGFTGVLNVPVGKANNGKFANLYYYHSGKFDFVGSSAISDGRAKFAFSHASNYLIVIDDYAYGEDVSSAAGMTETTETSAVPYVAALVVVSAFAASAVVLKKRLSK